MRRSLALPIAFFAGLAAGVQHLGCSSSSPSGPEPDTDGDGLSDAEELNVYGTSPVLADTDGDGFNDYQEVVTFAFDPTNDPYHFNPRVADVPQMTLVMTGPPLVRFQSTDSMGMTHTVDYSIADNMTASESWGQSPSTSRSDTYSTSQTVGNDNSTTIPLGSSVSQMSMTPNGPTVSQTTTIPLGPTVSRTFSGSGPVSGSDAGAARDASIDARREMDASRDARVPATTDAAREASADSGRDAAGRAARDASSDAAASASPESTTVTNDPGTVSTTITRDPGSTSTTVTTDPATLTLTNSVSTTVNPSTTFSTSYTLTHDQTRLVAETLTRDESYAQSHDVTATGGFLKVGTIIQNTSSVAFRVTNIVLGAAFLRGPGDIEAIANLYLDEGTNASYQPFALAPGEQTGVTTFATIVLTLATTVELLVDMQAIDVRLAVYELSDATGKPFAFSENEIGAKTALVAIDYGPQRGPELHQVATNLDPAHPGVTTARVFSDILRIPYAAAPQTGLTSVRDMTVSASGSLRWMVAHRHNEGPVVATTSYGLDGSPYDFDGIELRAGDVLQVALARAQNASVLNAEPTAVPMGTLPTRDGGIPPATGPSAAGAPALGLGPDTNTGPPPQGFGFVTDGGLPPGFGFDTDGGLQVPSP
jgi:hypothetical protein